jgi:hypothetical protein
LPCNYCGLVVVARAFAISPTAPQVALRPLWLEVSALAAVPEVAGALLVPAASEWAVPGDVEAPAVSVPAAVLVVVLVLPVLIALVLVLALLVVVLVSDDRGPVQSRVTRFPAFTRPSRAIALPSTGSVAGAVDFDAASVASPSALSRTVIVFPSASTATISACTCGPVGVAGSVALVVEVAVLGFVAGEPSGAVCVCACTTAAPSHTPRIAVHVGIFINSLLQLYV